MRGGVVPSEGPGIRDLGCLSGLGPSLTKILRAMIGAWTRAEGYLVCVEATPEAIARRLGISLASVMHSINKAPNRCSRTDNIPGARDTFGYVIKKIAQ